MELTEVEFVWHPNEKMDFADYDRAHAVIVTSDERVLVRIKNGEARITGGRINQEDESLENALRRELLEEMNITLDKCDYLGYLGVDDPENNLRENWARMVARVSRIGEARPDPDRENNWIYGRVLMPISDAIQKFVRDMPDGGTDKIVEQAIVTARQKNYFTDEPCNETEVLNRESKDGDL